MQAELKEVHEFIKYTLLPLVFDQVSGVETSLRQVDIATGTLSSKKAVKLGKAVKSSLRGGSVGAASVGGRGGDSDTLSSRVNEGHEDSTPTADSDGSGVGKGAMDVSTRGGRGKSTEISEAMEQAQVLRAELERVQAGIRLLGSSVERLNDVVRSDTKFCGGVFEYLCGSCAPSVLLQWLPSSGVSRQQGVYSSVSMDESVHNQL